MDWKPKMNPQQVKVITHMKTRSTTRDILAESEFCTIIYDIRKEAYKDSCLIRLLEGTYIGISKLRIVSTQSCREQRAAAEIRVEKISIYLATVCTRHHDVLY
jgi:hypothetical protein